jgi:hypothetical protein
MYVVDMADRQTLEMPLLVPNRRVDKRYMLVLISTLLSRLLL